MIILESLTLGLYGPYITSMINDYIEGTQCMMGTKDIWITACGHMQGTERDRVTSTTAVTTTIFMIMIIWRMKMKFNMPWISHIIIMNNGVLLKGRRNNEQVSKTFTFSFHNRWANPIYLGAYSAGLFTTLGCFALALDPQTPLLFLLVWSLVCFHLILFYKLVTGECCPKLLLL